MSEVVEIAQLITAVATLVVAFTGFIVALRRIKDVHDVTNSRMDEMLEVVKTSSYAAGQKAEQDRAEKG